MDDLYYHGMTMQMQTELADIRNASPYNLRLAAPADVPTLQEFRREAASWIRNTHGVEQWQREYPEELFLAAIARRETYMVDFQTTAVATITIGREPDARKWSPGHLRDPAVYVSKLMVARSRSGDGLGAELLDFADGLGYDENATWTRLDAWTDNEKLHNYYQRLGFECLGVTRSEAFDSGAIFQRQVPPFPYIGTRLSGVEQFITRDV